MDIGKSINWTTRLEEHLKETGERSNCYAWLHKKAEKKYSNLTTFIDLPVIVGSTIAGTLSIGSSGLFGDNETTASMGIGILSLCVGVVNTIGSYFAWSKRAESHRISAIQYSKLFRFISIELALPREERIACADLLKIVRETYERLQEVSKLIPQEIIDEFKSKFTTYDVSKPTECNGLESVDIYGDTVDAPSIEFVKKVELQQSPKNETNKIVLDRQTTDLSIRIEETDDGTNISAV